MFEAFLFVGPNGYLSIFSNWFCSLWIIAMRSEWKRKPFISFEIRVFLFRTNTDPWQFFLAINSCSDAPTHTTKSFEMQTKPSFFTLSLANALVYTYAMNRMWKKIHSRFSSSILTFIFVFTLLHFLRLFTLFLCGTHNFWHMDVWEYVWICANKAQTKYIVYVIGVFTLAILFGLRLINRTGIGLFFLCFVPASLAWALNI